MSDKGNAMPFTLEERAELVAMHKDAVANMYSHTGDEVHHVERYEATVRQAEKKLRLAEAETKAYEEQLTDREAEVAVLIKERDACKGVVAAVIANGTIEGAVLMHRRLSKDDRSPFWTEYHGRIADALEAMPWPA